MKDQAILHLIHDKPPPFEADPQIIEWIEQQATTHRNCLDIKAVQISREQAAQAHLEETNALNKSLCDNLKAL
jgi:hypothetical protein